MQTTSLDGVTIVRKALDLFQKIAEDPVAPIQRPIEWEQAIRYGLAIAVRVKNDPDQARAAKRAEDTAAAQQRQFEEYIDISKEIRELTGNWQRLRTPSDGSG